MKTRCSVKSAVIFSLWSLALVVLVVMPDAACASGITEFSDPMEKVVNTITGKWGMLISVAGMAVCGVVYIFNRQDMAEGFKMLLQVVFGICFICFASTIVASMFSFGGALI